MLAPVPLPCHRHHLLSRNWSSRPRRCFLHPESQLLLLCYELSGFSIAAPKSYSCVCLHAHLLCVPGVRFLSTHDHSNACNFTYSFKMKRFSFCFGQKIESNFSPVDEADGGQGRRCGAVKVDHGQKQGLRPGFETDSQECCPRVSTVRL